ncbi:MAG: CBS domain-containing protein [Candidatus Saccharimonadales bacterium]
MLSFVLGLAFSAIALCALVLYKAYRHVPTKELKRLARRGDSLAILLYKPAAYGASLNALLWLIAGLAFAGGVVMFADILPAWLAVISVAAVIWVGFVWIPSGETTNAGLWLARTAAPSLSWLTERLHPLLAWIEQFVRRHRPITIHTGLFEKSDLIDLLERQKDQPDNRISIGEIALLTHALSFGDKRVSEVLVPKRVVTVVKVDESIGPVLTNELHSSGHSRFPVYEGKHDNIIGILYLRDLVMTKKTGTVRDLMKQRLSYIHEEFTLYQTLQAFLKTKQHLFLVVNSFEEFVGIVTVEDIIEQIIGKPIIDEFDNYDDLRAVAATAAQEEHKARLKAEQEPAHQEATTSEPPEVVK